MKSLLPMMCRLTEYAINSPRIQAVIDESQNHEDGQFLIAPDHISMWLSHLQAKNVDFVGDSLQSVRENGISQVITLATSSKFGSEFLLSLNYFWKYLGETRPMISHYKHLLSHERS